MKCSSDKFTPDADRSPELLKSDRGIPAPRGAGRRSGAAPVFRLPSLRVFLPAALLCVAAFSCAPKDYYRRLEILDGRLLAASYGGESPVYLRIGNYSTAPDALVGASCACASETRLYETYLAGFASRRRELKGLYLPAGRIREFSVRGRHLVLSGLKRELRAGEKIKLILIFKNSGNHAVEVPVVQASPE